MNSLSPLTPSSVEQPNPEMLRNQGWYVKSCHGRYCVAWQSPNHEVLLVWRDSGWFRVHGGSPVGS